MEENVDTVEVLDLTFIVPVAGQDGEPAKLTYTVREHLGDAVTEAPGMLSIVYAPRSLPGGRTLRGRTVRLNTAQFVGMETDVRLEQKVRPSAASILNPAKASIEELKKKHGVSGEIHGKHVVS